MIGWFVYLTKMYGLFSFLSSVLAGSFVFLLFWYTGTTAAIISFFVSKFLYQLVYTVESAALIDCNQFCSCEQQKTIFSNKAHCLPFIGLAAMNSILHRF